MESQNPFRHSHRVLLGLCALICRNKEQLEAQKLVPDLEAAHERIHEHSLELENARTREVYGVNSRVGKILEIHEEDPGRIHVVLIRAAVGF